MKYSEIVFKIINSVLKVKEGDVISISSEIQNAGNSPEPLSELPLVEELAVGIRKKKAFPVLEISTENLQKRFFSEMNEEIYALPLNYYLKWIEDIDCFIEVGWKHYGFENEANRSLMGELQIAESLT